MPVKLSDLMSNLDPRKTVLFFGAGSSQPSHAPSTTDLKRAISDRFKIVDEAFSLSEIASLAERKSSRRELIDFLRSKLSNLKPSGSLLNLPLYDWSAIFTTNYDQLIESAYKHQDKTINRIACDFDFSSAFDASTVKLYKLHGTIEQDIVDGSVSKIILTESDYKNTFEYRKRLFDRFKVSLNENDVIIVGYSLGDPDIRALIDDSLASGQVSGSGNRVTVLSYESSEGRAALLEMRGIRVCFGSLDEFFEHLALQIPKQLELPQLHNVDYLDAHQRVVTTDVAHELAALKPNVSGMYNGWPATYADIQDGATFSREMALFTASELKREDVITCVILGAAGVGKTTCARQSMLHLKGDGFIAWEHKSDHNFPHDSWFRTAMALREKGVFGVLFLDDFHYHLHSINKLLNSLASDRVFNLKILLCDSPGNWSPRTKSPVFFKNGTVHNLRKLQGGEVESLLRLIEDHEQIRKLVGTGLAGFSVEQMRKRIIDRCSLDTFVCMKSIFSSERFDDIILREFASMEDAVAEVYQLVSALQAVGVRVHRQLIIRLLNIDTNFISLFLLKLEDVVSEYVHDQREGIYSWRVRHDVIAEIVAKYKLYEEGHWIELFRNIINVTQPTYPIEVRSLVGLCDGSSGIARIKSKDTQNELLRMIISVAPGERLPRHRLIRNLIQLKQFEDAETEIRIFGTEKRGDTAVDAYRIDLMIARATRVDGILIEDRIAILVQARDFAEAMLQQKGHARSAHSLRSYAELGLQLFKFTKSYDVWDDAISRLKQAEEEIGDPEISRTISILERRFAGGFAANP